MRLLTGVLLLATALTVTGRSKFRREKTENPCGSDEAWTPCPGFCCPYPNFFCCDLPIAACAPDPESCPFSEKRVELVQYLEGDAEEREAKETKEAKETNETKETGENPCGPDDEYVACPFGCCPVPYIFCCPDMDCATDPASCP